MDDDVYDTPPPRPSPNTPPSLPPKKSSGLRSSFCDKEGLSKTAADKEDLYANSEILLRSSPDSRPTPRPRTKTVRKSSGCGETLASPSPRPDEESPSGAPKPVPRPRLRQNSLKTPSDQPLSVSESQLEDRLPPTADEVEKMLNETVERELAEEEEQKQQSHQPQQEDAWPSGQLSHGDTVSNGNWPAKQFSDSFGRGVGTGDGLRPGVLSTDIDTVTQAEEESYYENSNLIKSVLAPSRPNAQLGAQTSGGGHGNDDGFDSAFGGSDTYEDYAKVQKQKETPSGSSEFDSSFDPFVTSQANNKPGLPSSHKPGMLQPTKVWDGSSDLDPSWNTGGAATAADNGAVAVGEDPGLEGEGGEQGDSEQYEAVWFTRREEEDKAGMVRPQSDLMAFTPKPQAGGAPPPCQPAYGEPSGEYIGLDPTYNIPPPSRPPPPLPAHVMAKPKPPTVPPRPPPSNSPSPQKQTLTFQESSHVSETSTDTEFAAEPFPSVFEGLPTPGFGTPVHPEDPFKYSGFSMECEEFNRPHSTDAAAAATNEESGIYEVEEFVAEWPQNMDDDTESDSTYYDIEHDVGAVVGASVSRDDSIRLSQVPPPPPRPRRNIGAEAAARGMPSPQPNVYSLAHNDEQGKQPNGITAPGIACLNMGVTPITHLLSVGLHQSFIHLAWGNHCMS